MKNKLPDPHKSTDKSSVSKKATHGSHTEVDTAIRDDLRRSIDIEKCFEPWLDSVRTRVKTANEASNRSRYTLIFLALVSAGFVMAVFTYFYSWNKEFAYQYLANPDLPNAMRDGVLREYLSTQTYQLPILGIKIMASDVQIFGPLILMTVSTWNYYEVRREHYTIGRLLGDLYFTMGNLMANRDGKAIILCQEVYHNLIGYTVFNVIPYDTPIESLTEHVVSSERIKDQSVNVRLRRGVIRLLVFTPLISIAFIALTRILTFVVIRSAITGKVHSIRDLSDSRIFLLILSAVLISLSTYICFVNLRKIFTLESSTRKLLDEFQHWAFEGKTPGDMVSRG